VAIAWMLFASLAIPSLIESAYRGESFAFLNNLVGGSKSHGIEMYLDAWADMSARFLGMLLVFGILPLPLAFAGRECQAYLDRGHPNPHLLRPVVFNSMIAVAAFVTVLWLFVFEPVAYVHLIAEDYWAEYGTFAAFGMATCFLVWAIVEHPALRRAGPILLALGAFFVAMEEISWGQRILDLSTPGALAARNLQGEANLHNLFPVELVQYLVAGAGVFVWVMLFPVVSDRWPWLRRLSDALGVPRVPVHLWPFFLLAIVALLSRSLLLSGELGELLLGVAISAFALDWIMTLRRGSEFARAATSMAIVTMLALQVLLAVFLVEFYSWPHALSAKLNLFASKQLPAVGMQKQAVQIFDYILENPQHLRWDTRIRHGMALSELGRFEEASEVLEGALEDHRFLAHTQPMNPDHDRGVGDVLVALHRDSEAQEAYQRAIHKDQLRLKSLPDSMSEARVHWSLGRTFVALGDTEAASLELTLARALPSDAKTQYRLDMWMRENLDTATYTALVGPRD